MKSWLGDLVDRRGLGEALFLFELAVAEGVERLRDLGYVLVRELAQLGGSPSSHFASVR